MSEAGVLYLFDVGVIALAHSRAPVRDTALSYIQDAIAGEIDTVVPYPALTGAHNILTAYQGQSNTGATRVLQNFMDAKRIYWYSKMSEEVVRGGFWQASEANVGGWDSYYAQVAVDEGVNTVLMIDGFDAEIILSPNELRKLNRFLGN